MRRSEFDAAHMIFDLYQRGVIAVDQDREEATAQDPIGAIQDLLTSAYQRLQEKRSDAPQAYEEVLEPRPPQPAREEGSDRRHRGAQPREGHEVGSPRARCPYLTMDFVELTKQNFDPHEGFVLSRVNGQWDVQSILKLCPMAEEDALMIFSRLLERKVIELRDT